MKLMTVKITGFFLPLALIGCGTVKQTVAPATLLSTIKKDEFRGLSTVALEKRQAYDASVASKAPGVEIERSENEAIAAQQALTDAQNSALDSKLSEVLQGCNVVISGMTEKASDQEKNAFWLSMSGLIAGAVIGPAAAAANAMAHRSLISAASGWAGATNLAGQSLRTVGLAGDAVATARNSIVVSLNNAIALATDSTKNYSERFSGVQKAQAACISYAITVPGAIVSDSQVKK